MPSDSHQDQWSSQWHQWHSSNPMMCTRPMPIKSYLGPCGTCHSLRVKESSCTPHLHDWHANVQARMLTPMCPCSCPCPCPSSLHQVSWCLTAMCALQQKTTMHTMQTQHLMQYKQAPGGLNCSLCTCLPINCFVNLVLTWFNTFLTGVNPRCAWTNWTNQQAHSEHNKQQPQS